MSCHPSYDRQVDGGCSYEVCCCTKYAMITKCLNSSLLLEIWFIVVSVLLLKCVCVCVCGREEGLSMHCCNQPAGSIIPYHGPKYSNCNVLFNMPDIICENIKLLIKCIIG